MRSLGSNPTEVEIEELIEVTLKSLEQNRTNPTEEEIKELIEVTLKSWEL